MLNQNMEIRKKNIQEKLHCYRLIILKICFTFSFSIITLTFSACGKPQRTEMRALLPNNAVVYLETNDLAKTLESLTGSQAFQELTDRKPDFSFAPRIFRA